MASACVIKFSLKSSIFVSTETKYVSQDKYIWMFPKYIGDPVIVELSKLLQFLFFSMENDRIACVVSRFQVKLSRAKLQSSGKNFVASQAQLNAIP